MANLLLVDDDDGIRELLKVSLEKAGHRVRDYRDGMAAKNALETEQPHVIVSDCLLPRLSGFDLCAHVRSNAATANLPVILMSAMYKDSKVQKEALTKYGANLFITKPFNLAEFISRLDELLKKAGVIEAGRASQKITGFAGELPDGNLAMAIFKVVDEKRTGTLRLIQGERVKEIMFIDGQPEYVKSSVERERLGQFLAAKGKISQQQIRDALQIMGSLKSKFGETLIQMKLISSHELYDFLREQVIWGIRDLFSWTDGKYQFIDGPLSISTRTPYDFDMVGQVFSAIREKSSLSFLQRKYRPALGLPIGRLPRIRSLTTHLPGDAQRIIELIDGHRSLNDVLGQQSKQPELVFHTIHILVQLQAVEFKTAVRDAQQDGRSAELNKILAGLKDKDYFQVLGVAPGTDLSRIKKAYFKLAKQYHPDTVESQDGVIREQMQTLFSKISEAYETLSDDEKRGQYEQNLRMGITGDPNEAAQKVLQAELEFQKGEVFLKKRSYEQARDCFRRAVELNPGEAEHYVYLGWTKFLMEDGGRTKAIAEAQSLIQEGLSRRRNVAMAYYFLGQIAKATGDEERLVRELKKALEIDPECEDAERELRLINMRRSKDKKSKSGLFGRPR